MASQSRKFRGYETQKLLAGWFKTRGWPFAEPVGAGRPGADVTGMPGVAIEAKARAKFEPLAWLKQAASERRHGVPAVVFRCNGQGEAALPDWGVLMTLADFTALLREAGYGSGDSTPDDNEQRSEPDDEEAKHDDAFHVVPAPLADLTVAHNDTVLLETSD